MRRWGARAAVFSTRCSNRAPTIFMPPCSAIRARRTGWRTTSSTTPQGARDRRHVSIRGAPRAAILSYIPTAPSAKTDSINYTGTDTLTDRADEYTSKLDHTVFDWWRVSASYLHYKSREPGGNSLGTLPGGSSNGPYLLFRKADATAVNSTMTLNPTTVLVVRYGFNRFPNFTEGISYGFSPATLGFPSTYTRSIQAQYF